NFKPLRDTGLREIEDVPGGELQNFNSDGDVTRTVLWDPAKVYEQARSRTQTEAASALRTALQSTGNCLVGEHASVLHCLSGGLDSSIVAGCLAQAPTRPEVTALNLYIAPTDRDMPVTFPNVNPRYLAKLRRVAGHGDERAFARLVAERWQF